VEKFLLLDAVLSFIQSAVSSRYITWFHVHVVYIVYIHTVHPIEQAGYELSKPQKEIQLCPVSVDSVPMVYHGN
jgi:hypothetical protein